MKSLDFYYNTGYNIKRNREFHLKPNKSGDRKMIWNPDKTTDQIIDALGKLGLSKKEVTKTILLSPDKIEKLIKPKHKEEIKKLTR
jgi:hypothetical protein